jgi:hypothetical protein
LEEIFMDLTRDAVEYHGVAGAEQAKDDRDLELVA